MNATQTLDRFCLYIRDKYINPSNVSLHVLAQEWATAKIVQGITGEPKFPAEYFLCRMPSGIRGLTLPTGSGYCVLVNKDDDRTEWVRTRLHEEGETLEERLCCLWPEYGSAIAAEREEQGYGEWDKRYDVFADMVLQTILAALPGSVIWVAYTLGNLLIMPLQRLVNASKNLLPSYQPWYSLQAVNWVQVLCGFFDLMVSAIMLGVSSGFFKATVPLLTKGAEAVGALTGRIESNLSSYRQDKPAFVPDW